MKKESRQLPFVHKTSSLYRERILRRMFSSISVFKKNRN